MTSRIDSYPQVSESEAGADFGRVLDQAQHGPVTIVRRGAARFILMRGDDEVQLTAPAAGTYPRLTLDQLLAGYDRGEHRADWPDDAPAGLESL